MNPAIYSTLEFNKIREILAQKSATQQGKEALLTLEPSTDAEEVHQLLAETSEAVRILELGQPVPFGGIRDLRTFLQRAVLGGVLDPEELMAVGSTLYAARRMKQFFEHLTEPFLLLDEKVQDLQVLRSLEHHLENLLTDHGQVRDDASVELREIRREMAASQVRVKQKLQSLLHSAEYQKYYQEALVTIRNDRYVIPVKQEYRHAFPGIVHDQSASGATVYIEPLVVVELNNAMKQLVAREKNEVERLLRQASMMIGQQEAVIRRNSEILTILDVIFVKAQYAHELKALCPVVDETGQLELFEARHPLIPSSQVVPIDVAFGGNIRTLLITGPNTGGKTVALKVAGLMALMAQSGLFLPVRLGSKIPVFRSIFADIGDEQSIEQSLSTFSAHMTHLVRILQEVTAQDLVLLDEIGAGTDPDEGSALAMAIIEHLHQLGCLTMVTTHYSALKTFAYTQAGMLNASVEFDPVSLRPTYRLLLGIPGSSNAFAISRRLGLSDELIEQAKKHITESHANLETVLRSLEIEKQKYEAIRAEAEELKREAELLRAKAEQERSELQQRRNEILRKARQEAQDVLRYAKRTAEETITELKAQFSVKQEGERQKVIQKSRHRLKAGLGQNHDDDFPQSDLPELDLEKIQIGQEVLVLSLEKTGQILSIQGKTIHVQVGPLKMHVSASDCRLTGRKAQPIKKAKPPKLKFRLEQVSRELDVRGTTIEEALPIIEKYLDEALLSGHSQVTIIHGKGTGALRKGVREALKNHPHIKSLTIGEYYEGGDGVTVVDLV